MTGEPVGGVWDTATPGAAGGVVPVSGSAAGMSADWPCGGFAPASGLAAAHGSPDGTQAKRTSYAVFGWSTSTGASADGSGSSPLAGSPAV
ncbi:hypothetical protein [Streptomyces sp. NBC_01546]|uniref:hypothetical protein n=1 Tax=Streptomyces sp. NBC_01546 TaxID=2975872 RepID=UPI0038666E1A